MLSRLLQKTFHTYTVHYSFTAGAVVFRYFVLVDPNIVAVDVTLNGEGEYVIPNREEPKKSPITGISFNARPVGTTLMTLGRHDPSFQNLRITYQTPGFAPVMK